MHYSGCHYYLFLILIGFIFVGDHCFGNGPVKLTRTEFCQWQKMVKQNNYKAVQDFLDKHQQKKDKIMDVIVDSDTREQALFYAVRNNYSNMVDVLCREQKDFDKAVDKYGMTALMVAAAKGKIQCVKSLITAGANSNILLSGASALFFAVFFGHFEIADLLFANKPDDDVVFYVLLKNFERTTNYLRERMEYLKGKNINLYDVFKSGESLLSRLCRDRAVPLIEDYFNYCSVLYNGKKEENLDWCLKSIEQAPCDDDYIGIYKKVVSEAFKCSSSERVIKKTLAKLVEYTLKKDGDFWVNLNANDIELISGREKKTTLLRKYVALSGMPQRVHFRSDSNGMDVDIGWHDVVAAALRSGDKVVLQLLLDSGKAISLSRFTERDLLVTACTYTKDPACVTLFLESLYSRTSADPATACSETDSLFQSLANEVMVSQAAIGIYPNIDMDTNINWCMDSLLGATVLHFAVAQSNTAAAKDLLERGAKADSLDYFGLSPMQIASFVQNNDMIELIQYYGVGDAGAECDKALPWLHIAAFYNLESDRDLALPTAINQTIKLSCSLYELSPLHCAVMSDNAEKVRFLVNHSADLNKEGKVVGLKGYAPLHTAIFFGKYLAAEALFSCEKEDCKVDVNKRVGKIKNTPLHLAVTLNDVRFIMLLINKGARVNTANKWGYTSLCQAFSGQHFNIYLIVALLKGGACPDAAKNKFMSSVRFKLSAVSEQQEFIDTATKFTNLSQQIKLLATETEKL